MQAIDLADVLTSMAQSVAKRDGMPTADFAHYSLKFALIAGAEACIEIAKRDVAEMDDQR